MSPAFLGHAGPASEQVPPAISIYSKGIDRSDSEGLGCQWRWYGQPSFNGVWVR